MTVQSQDLEHGGKPPERPRQQVQKGARDGTRNEPGKSPAGPKDRDEGTYSGNNTPSRPD